MELEKHELPVNNGLIYINFIATILYITWWLTPYIHRNVNKMYLFIILIVWLATALLIELKVNKVKLPLILLPITAWVSYIIILRLLNFSTASWGNYFNNILFWFSIIIFSFNNNYMSIIFLRKTIIYSFAIIVINLINNIWIIIDNPQMLQFITNESSLGITARSTNVGSTAFSLIVVLYISLMWSILTYEKKSIKRGYIVSIIGISFMYVLIAAKTTALILLVVSIISFIYFQGSSKKETRSRFLIKFLLILLSLMGLIIAPHILQLIAELINNDNISERLFALSSLMKGDNINSNSMSFRLFAWDTSIKTFIANPFLGIGYHTYMGLNFSGIGIGEHSEIFDNCAKYGLVGVLFLASIFRVFWSHYLKKLNNSKYYSGVKNVFFIFFIYSFFNSSITPGSGILLFLIAPLIAVYDIKRDKSNLYKCEEF